MIRAFVISLLMLVALVETSPRNLKLVSLSCDTSCYYNDIPIIGKKGKVWSKLNNTNRNNVKIGAFKPYKVASEKALDKHGLIDYKLFEYDDYHVLLRKGLALITYISFKDNASHLKINGTMIDSSLSVDEFRTLFASNIAYETTGNNHLTKIDKGVYEENSDSMCNVYMKCCNLGLVEFVFISDKIYCVSIFPENIECTWP